MRVVITGATGNVGTSVISSLSTDPTVEAVLAVARRRPDHRPAKVTWAAADVSRDDLAPFLRGADVVIHLAWLIQPSRDLDRLRRTNVLGSHRVFQAAAEAGVPAIVHASSVGAYSPGPKGRAVDESWPTEGIATSFYSRHKAAVERLLDSFERERPEVRVVRLRPALIFKREAAAEIRRLFIGPLVPRALIRPKAIPFVPDVPGLRFQALHSDDAGEAYRLAATADVRGAFNLAAEPVLDAVALAELLGARPVKAPPRLIRAGAAVTWRLRLQPTSPGWVDMALQAPIMDTTRARRELGWEPRRSSKEALTELLEGLRLGVGAPTPPLAE